MTELINLVINTDCSGMEVIKKDCLKVLKQLTFFHDTLEAHVKLLV